MQDVIAIGIAALAAAWCLRGIVRALKGPGGCATPYCGCGDSKKPRPTRLVQLGTPSSKERR